MTVKAIFCLLRDMWLVGAGLLLFVAAFCSGIGVSVGLAVRAYRWVIGL